MPARYLIPTCPPCRRATLTSRGSSSHGKTGCRKTGDGEYGPHQGRSAIHLNHAETSCRFSRAGMPALYVGGLGEPTTCSRPR